MKNFPHLLDCCLLKILPQGFRLNAIKANCKAKPLKKKRREKENSKPEDGVHALEGEERKNWVIVCFL